MLRAPGVMVLCAAAWLAFPVPGASQPGGEKPPRAAEKKSRAEPEKPAPPPAPKRKAPGTDPGGERPRSDVPVSFPVDI
jgi:hypothetical protein